MSLAVHYWLGDVHHCSGPCLRKDVYCVEWDVKPYCTIPYLCNKGMKNIKGSPILNTSSSSSISSSRIFI